MKNKKKEKEYNRKYYLLNRERLRKAHIKNYWDNVEYYKKRSAKYRALPEIRKRLKDYRNLPEVKTYRRKYGIKWRKANKEHMKKYYLKNREKYLAYFRKYQAKKKLEKSKALKE